MILLQVFAQLSGYGTFFTVGNLTFRRCKSSPASPP
jgi:hypothetical protein